MADTLADTARVVAPDLPGFGPDAVAVRPWSLEDFARLTDALFEQRRLPQRFVLGVHDVGALFGLAWAVEHRERLAGLIILNASVFADRRWHWGARILRVPLLGEMAMHGLPRSAFRRELRRASRGGIDDAAIARAFAAFGPAARASALHLYRLQGPALLAGLPVRVRALAADVPTLVLWGDRDPYLPSVFAERFGAAVVRRYPERGHWPHVEAPGRVAADIAGFLEAHGLRAV